MHETTVARRLAAAGALISAALLAQPVQAAACTGEPAGALVCEINEQRRSHDLPAVAADPRLERAASRHANDMVRRSYFSHVTPGGATLRERLALAGYARGGSFWAAGEVLAWGRGARATASATVAAWMASPGHRRVLLGRRYRDVGAGVVAGDPQGGDGVTFAAELGVRGR